MKQKKKLFYILIIIIIAFSAFLFLRTDENKDKTKQTSNSSTPANQNSTTSVSDTLIIGKADAPVTIVEYADFKCPNCGTFLLNAGKQIRQEYIDAGIAKIEFRAFPFLGPDSARALRGAYCANDLGEFVDYHDGVFNHMWENYYKNGNFAVEIEDILTNDILIDIAQRAGADQAKFSECVNGLSKNPLIDRDNLKAAEDGVQGTPTVIIGDQKVVGPQPFAVYKTLIDIQNR